MSVEQQRLQRLRDELVRIEDSLDSFMSADSSLIETQMRRAGLEADRWLVVRRIASIENPGGREEEDASANHRKAQEIFSKLQKQRKEDLLPVVMEKLKAFESTSAAFDAAVNRSRKKG